MFGKYFARDLIVRSTDNATDRRRFLKAAGITSLGVVGTGLVGSAIGDAAGATEPKSRAAEVEADAGQPSDGAILNFALNLEYLEAEFYHRAYLGRGLPEGLTTGKGARGGVTGGRTVPFKTKTVKNLAHELQGDEEAHVKFLRTALGASRVARPSINLTSSFTAAARAAGLIKRGETFDPYANEDNFLVAAFIFEDVGVTAYKGAAPLISNKTYLEAAAGILAVEAYHAASIRTLLFERGLTHQANAISGARDSLDGHSDDDRSISYKGKFNLAPSDGNGIAFSRSAADVLNVVYLTPKAVSKGGFFPSGVNGTIRMSGSN